MITPFSQFIENARTLRAGLDFNRKGHEDRPPIPFVDSTEFKSRSADMFASHLSGISTAHGVANLANIPFTDWLTAAGAVINFSDIVQRSSGLSVPAMGDLVVSPVTEDEAPELQPVTLGSYNSETYTLRTELLLTRLSRHTALYDVAAYLKTNVGIALRKKLQSEIVAGAGFGGAYAGIANSAHLGYTTSTTAAGAPAALAAALEALAPTATAYCVIASPAARKALMGVPALSGGSVPAWTINSGAEALMGVPAFVDTGLSGSKLVVGDFRTVQITLSPEMSYTATGTQSGSQQIVAFLDYVTTLRDQAFALITLA